MFVFACSDGVLVGKAARFGRTGSGCGRAICAAVRQCSFSGRNDICVYTSVCVCARPMDARAILPRATGKSEELLSCSCPREAERIELHADETRRHDGGGCGGAGGSGGIGSYRSRGGSSERVERTLRPTGRSASVAIAALASISADRPRAEVVATPRTTTTRARPPAAPSPVRARPRTLALRGATPAAPTHRRRAPCAFSSA